MVRVEVHPGNAARPNACQQKSIESSLSQDFTGKDQVRDEDIIVCNCSLPSCTHRPVIILYSRGTDSLNLEAGKAGQHHLPQAQDGIPFPEQAKDGPCEASKRSPFAIVPVTTPHPESKTRRTIPLVTEQAKLTWSTQTEDELVKVLSQMKFILQGTQGTSIPNEIARHLD